LEEGFELRNGGFRGGGGGGLLIEADREAAATCSKDECDITSVESTSFLLLGNGGATASRPCEDEDVAVESVLVGLGALRAGSVLDVCAPGEEDLRTCMILSFSNIFSAFFIVWPVLLACRLCFISVVVKCGVVLLPGDEKLETCEDGAEGGGGGGLDLRGGRSGGTLVEDSDAGENGLDLGLGVCVDGILCDCERWGGGGCLFGGEGALLGDLDLFEGDFGRACTKARVLSTSCPPSTWTARRTAAKN
jgi:hypothetical protein